jgi:hypothetical protein
VTPPPHAAVVAAPAAVVVAGLDPATQAGGTPYAGGTDLSPPGSGPRMTFSESSVGIAQDSDRRHPPGA